MSFSFLWNCFPRHCETENVVPWLEPARAAAPFSRERWSETRALPRLQRFTLVFLCLMIPVRTCPAQAQVAPVTESDWTGSDVGQVAISGSHQWEGNRVLVRGAGADIWGSGDSFYFSCVPWDGDCEVTARVVSITQTHPWAKVGVMIRSELSEFSPHAMVAMTPEQGSVFLRRSTASDQTQDDAHQAMRMLQRPSRLTFQQRGSAGVAKAEDSVTAVALPRWIRLVRQGDAVVAYDSADGTT